MINLDAPHKVTASDGETRVIGVGEIFLIVTGRQAVRDEGDVDVGLSNKEGLHSCPVMRLWYPRKYLDQKGLPDEDVTILEFGKIAV